MMHLDMTKAVFADMSSLALMVEIYRAVKKGGGEMRLSGVGESTARIFTLFRLDGIFG